MRKSDWLSIEQLTDRYEESLLIAAPELVDGDFNAQGVSRGYYQDDEGWIGTGWNSCHDIHTKVVVNPTHFIRIVGPYSEEELENAEIANSNRS